MKNYFNIYLFTVVFVLSGLSNTVLAQWNINISTLQEYNDNPFHSHFATESFINTLNLNIERSIGSFGFGYYGNYANFSESSTKNYYWHQLSAWKTSNNIMYGLNVEQRLNGNDFSFYNYINYAGFLKYRFNIKNIYIFGNTGINVTDYNELNDLDNVLGFVNISANKSFKTKTTLISGLDLRYKNYFNTELKSFENLITNSNSAYTTQFNYFLKIAQSITPTTGIAAQYTGRNIIDGTAKTIRQFNFAYGDESKYFDDPISYEGYTASLQLTQILPMEIILRASYFYNNKEYPSQGTYIKADKFDSELTRIDTQEIINIGLQKKIYFGKKENSALTIALNYQNISNSSNSFWYDYKSNKINLGLKYNF